MDQQESDWQSAALSDSAQAGIGGGADGGTNQRVNGVCGNV